jgi:hypothetical protein
MKNKYIDIKVENSQLDNCPIELDKNIEKYMKIYDKCLNTYIAKNLDYGNSFSKLYEKFGLQSSVIRLWDKLNRLETLLEKEKEVDESIDDTLKDMANYCIMTLIERS